MICGHAFEEVGVFRTRRKVNGGLNGKEMLYVVSC
jgi:hypothetical protein